MLPDFLLEPFYAAEKAPADFRIGAEAEKFGICRVSGKPIAYDGSTGVIRVLDVLGSRYGWKPKSETKGGPTIALTRDRASVTLEPAAQLELSDAPREDLHQVAGAFEAHHGELREVSDSLGIDWLQLGFHPLAKQEELSWVPKRRYAIMREYLPTRGKRALDMMRRTATVQVNLDYADEEDAMRKLRICLALSPVLSAMTLNAPFYEGRVTDLLSQRAATWLEMDPDRSGLLSPLWKSGAGYQDYVDWALDVPMFLFFRGERLFANTGQTFRAFLHDGFEGERATPADWTLHLATLFPESRLKGPIEVRSCDAQSWPQICTVPALMVGLLYDPQALGEAQCLVDEITPADAGAARLAVPREGLSARLGTKPLSAFAEKLVDIARGGLSRRRRLNARGQDESIHLEPLARSVARSESPAHELTRELKIGPVDPAEIRRRCRQS